VNTIEMYKSISFYFQDESHPHLTNNQINFQNNISNQFFKHFNEIKSHINVLSYKETYIKVRTIK